MACSFFIGDSVVHNLQPFCPVRFNMASNSGHKYKRKHFPVVSRSRSLLEQAMLMKRAREKKNVENTGKTEKRLPLKPGKVQPRLHVPDHILKPPYVNSKSIPGLGQEPQIHDAEGIECMKASCRLAAQVLEYAGTLVRPSVTTDEIDKAVHKMIIEAGAYPSPLGYGGFPKSVCTSVNECLCHGIPDSRPLQDGDIINIDVTVYLNGYHGDTSKTFLCGNVDDAAKRLVKVTEDCMYKAISVCKAGVGFKQIGKKISQHADKFGYAVDRRFVGHGVGKIFHSEPIIFHYQPILALGSTDCKVWKDDWTTVTVDRSLAAQFEHTLLITETGAEILTQC